MLVAIGSIDMSERTVAEASSGFGGLMFLVGHFAVDSTVSIGFFIIIVGAIASELGIRLGGHCDGEEIFKRPRTAEVGVWWTGRGNRLG